MDSLAEIARLFSRSRDERLILGFLRQLLTRDELKEIDSRWKIVRMLHAGVPQRRIAAELGVSLCKITRGSRELKKKGGTFTRVLETEKETKR